MKKDIYYFIINQSKYNYFRRQKLGIEIKDNKTLGKIYEDIAQPIARQAGVAIGEVGKLIFSPIYYPTKYLNNRIEKWFERIENNVSKENRIEAKPYITIPTLQNLSLQNDEELLGEMFFNILQSSVDKTKQKFLSPAFPKILEQLTKDEAIMLVLLKKQKYKYHTKMDLDKNNNHFINEKIELNEFPLDKFEFQENLWLYNSHLHNLNLSGCWEYKEQEPIYSGNEIEKGSGAISYRVPEQIGIKRFSEFRLTEFGEAFAEVCITKECEEFLK